nr:uncharacterized protein LOC128704757 [Cherax quadricarinatus]
MAALHLSCACRIALMRRISGTKWGADRDLLYKFYIAMVCSKLTYASEVYGSASSSSLHRSDILQNLAICNMLGAFPSTPIAALEAESGIVPLLSVSSSAIHQALAFVLDHIPPQPLVLFSDSQSSLALLCSARPRSLRVLVCRTQSLLLRFLRSPGWSIYLQWVPAHVGIWGNEVADRAASLAHTLPTVTPLALGHSDFTRAVWKGIRHQWQEGLAHSLSSSALGSVRTFNGPCPWARHPNRSVDVALTRLRVGHSRLAVHLYRLRMTDSLYCPRCPLQPETVEHFLLWCRRYHSARTTLRPALRTLGVHTFTLPVLLNGKGFRPLDHQEILACTCSFLLASGRIRDI